MSINVQILNQKITTDGLAIAGKTTNTTYPGEEQVIEYIFDLSLTAQQINKSRVLSTTASHYSG